MFLCHHLMLQHLMPVWPQQSTTTRWPYLQVIAARTLTSFLQWHPQQVLQATPCIWSTCRLWKVSSPLAYIFLMSTINIPILLSEGQIYSRLRLFIPRTLTTEKKTKAICMFVCMYMWGYMRFIWVIWVILKYK